MNQRDSHLRRRKGLWTALTVAAMTGASAVTIALPATTANADPEPPPPPGTTAPPLPPLDPNAPPPPPLDPNAPPPPPLDPNAPPPPPEPGRVNDPIGEFSFVLPAGWIVADPRQLNYGSALLSKTIGPSFPGQPPPVANDTSILLGRLDLKLFAGAEADNTKAAIRLASDMGEFFMPFPGTRISPETIPLNADGMPGSASYYEVQFTDAAKPNGQIWAGVVGEMARNAPRGSRNERWFVVWLGTADNPVDKVAAKVLAESIRSWTPPPPPPPDPNAPPPPPPPPGERVGIPIPVETPVPEMMPPA